MMRFFRRQPVRDLDLEIEHARASREAAAAALMAEARALVAALRG